MTAVGEGRTFEEINQSIDGSLARIDAVLEQMRQLELAEIQANMRARAVAEAVLRGDEHAVQFHAKEFAAAELELLRLREARRVRIAARADQP